MKKNGYKQGVADALNHIGHVYMKMHENELAIVYLKRSYALHSELDNKRGMAVTLNNMATLAYQQNKLSGSNGAETLAQKKPRYFSKNWLSKLH